MIDLHTHLLPDWDDGAANWEETFEMCDIASRDGIQKIVLTPHVFRLSKHSDDFQVLEARFGLFKEKTRHLSLHFYRGAEVFIHHGMPQNIRKNNLTLNASNYLFVEFPSNYILPKVKELFFNLQLEGFIPIISHPERNYIFLERPDILYELIQMGSLGQLTAQSLSGEFGPELKKTSEIFLVNNLVHFIASDAHDAQKRPPKLSRGVEEARKIIGDEKALAMVSSIPQAILENKGIVNWGEPINPVKKKKWAIKLPKGFKN